MARVNNTTKALLLCSALVITGYALITSGPGAALIAWGSCTVFGGATYAVMSIMDELDEIKEQGETKENNNKENNNKDKETQQLDPTLAVSKEDRQTNMEELNRFLEAETKKIGLERGREERGREELTPEEWTREEIQQEIREIAKEALQIGSK